MGGWAQYSLKKNKRMKASKYIIHKNVNNKDYIYHQQSHSLLSIDSDLHKALNNNLINEIPSSIQQRLSSMGFLVDKELNECEIIQTMNLRARYSGDILRVTILPTLNCNFKCWYCYEKHKPSKLSTKSMKAIIEFIAIRLENSNVNTLVLDWFGGEPLMCFYNVIYPLSKDVIKLCEARNIEFKNIITTNGSLINKRMATLFKDIELNQFQITLDGDKEEHNKTRYSASLKNSFDKIIENINLIYEFSMNAVIELRINYTTQNIESISNILDNFPNHIRQRLIICPHVVWQYSSEIEKMAEKIEQFKKIAIDKGYNIPKDGFGTNRCISCYIENMNQYVINYDLKVYKCTARDFSEKESIGYIQNNGKFIPNYRYYRYFNTMSPFINNKCLECELLPSCLYGSSCLQKKVEGSTPKCCKSLVKESMDSNITNLILNTQL